jgi:hypothetical protein
MQHQIRNRWRRASLPDTQKLLGSLKSSTQLCIFALECGR